ncbi:hypothetical protein LT493_19005 [Streptomyces tricolor]|nr:hypothetical protein [Streptomyces tricolor]
MPEDDRRRTAYHESGHALLGMLQPGADPVRKITIVPRGRALGVTMSTPEVERYAHPRSTCADASSAPWAAWRRRRSSTGSSRRVPRTTSNRSPTSRAGWWPAGA